MIKFGQLNENDIIDYEGIIVRVKIEKKRNAQSIFPSNE